MTRSATYNVPTDSATQCSTDISLTIYERMCLVRWFEQGVIDAVNRGQITCPIYLSSGQESVAAALSCVVRDYQIFAQHRAHDIYLTFGGDPVKLRDELLGLPTGTSQGKAGSNCLQIHENDVDMYGHHGLIGENVPQGVGAALANGRKTLCLFGDGAAEEDYVSAAMGFAITHRLPVLFVCIDNNLSILTERKVRRSWSITDVARAFGIPAIDMGDDPWAVLAQVQHWTRTLPAFLNCYVCRHYWHVGVGADGQPEWNRFRMVEDTLKHMNLDHDILKIQERVRHQMEQLWDRKLSLKQFDKLPDSI